MKYKLHFKVNKANDVTDEQVALYHHIRKFLYPKGYALSDLTGDDANIFRSAWRWTDKNNEIQFYVNPTRMHVMKHKSLGSGRGTIIPLDYEELKFFDGLGFTLDDHVTRVSKQSIDDWFNHKESEIEILDREFGKLGYQRITTARGLTKYEKELPAVRSKYTLKVTIQIMTDRDVPYAKKYKWYNRANNIHTTDVALTTEEIAALKSVGYYGMVRI